MVNILFLRFPVSSPDPKSYFIEAAFFVVSVSNSVRDILVEISKRNIPKWECLFKRRVFNHMRLNINSFLLNRLLCGSNLKDCL